MYIIFEYLTYIGLVLLVATTLFAASLVYLLTDEAATRREDGTHKIARQTTHLLARDLGSHETLSPGSPQHSHTS